MYSITKKKKTLIYIMRNIIMHLNCSIFETDTTGVTQPNCMGVEGCDGVSKSFRM